MPMDDPDDYKYPETTASDGAEELSNRETILVLIILVDTAFALWLGYVGQYLFAVAMFLNVSLLFLVTLAAAKEGVIEL